MAEPKKRAIDEAKKRVVKKPDPVTLAYEDERRAKSSHRVVSVDSGLRDSWQDLRSRFKAREGQYTIVREIGRGGMGRVYKVMDNHIMRVVAMKILSPDLSRYRSAVEKFIEEAQATGQLEHPNIVPIYDIGITENRELFYVMKYVKGKTLAEVLFRIAGGESEISSQYSFIRMLQIFQQVCMGVHFAHQRGVLHRDLKPSNIMLGDYGEVMIFDWGLALLKQGTSAVVTHRSMADSRPRESSLSGTPIYMAPEQMSGDLSAIDDRSDIYALGSILYEILALRPPFEGEKLEVIRSKKLAGDFPLPHETNTRRTVPSELGEICVKAMSLDKEKRYQSAEQLYNAIQEFIEGSQDREKMQAMASEFVEKGFSVKDELSRVREQLKWQKMERQETARYFQGHEPLEKRKELWKLEDRVEDTERELKFLFTRAVDLFRRALAYQGDNRLARESLADLYWVRFLEMEEKGDHEAMEIFRQFVEYYHDSKYETELRGDGLLTLESEPAHATVSLFRYRESDRVLVPADKVKLGKTPVKTRIPMGSYLLVAEKKGFVPVRYPVWMERCGQAEGKIRLFRRGMVPEDFLLIPAGKYIMGSSSGMADAVEQCTPYVEDFFIARNPVTFGEYLAFLNDLVLEHPRTARRHVPRRTSGKPFWKLGPDGGYFLPEKDAEGDRHLPDYPILGVSWEDACAYVKWKSGKDGVPYRLPYEVEWEKAARGVDGRLYPWGNRFDPAFCDIRQTHAERPMPELVGDFRKDESPYGVRHMAGNMRNWCADHFFDGRQYWAVVRGGSWQGSEYSARVSYRNQFLITHTDSQTGFRLCFTPEEGAPGAQGAEAKDETSRQKSYNT